MRKLTFILVLLPSVSFGQTLFGVGVSASSLGAGIQGAVSVTGSSNIRAGFNIFDYSHNFSKDGINYGATLKLRSAQVTYDQFFRGHFASFHVSPGLLIYDGNSGSANANGPGGQSFTLGGTTYYSSSANPVNGAGSVTLNKVAPMILIGFGNLLPRGGKHFGISIEGGVVFQGSPSAKLALAGSSCLNSQQTACLNTATDPTVQSNIQAEQTKLNGDLNPFKYYPVISLTFSYKF
jgi:hypothetical protein